MRVLLVGAYGLIGSHVLSRLHAEGHEVVALGRRVREARRRFPQARWVAADLARMRGPADWARLLDGVEAVVNCAGVLQDSPRDSTEAVHVDSPSALARACVEAGVRRLIHVSAAGVDRAATAFGRTKADAEAALRATPLDWVILRPGLVLAPAAYGGSALLRGLAGLPLVIPLVHADRIVQVVAVSDVAETVVRCLQPGAPARVTFELLHPERTTLRGIVAALRAWLGFAPRPVVALPDWIAAAAAVAADGLARLGWRSPLRSTAVRQLADGVAGDPGPWMAKTGIRPLSLAQMLAASPAGVQERWFARAYFLKPLGLAALCLFWLVSGLVALGPGFDGTVAALRAAGLPPGAAAGIVVAGALADVALGLAAAARRTARVALLGMVAVSPAYLLGGTLLRPDLWLDPLGAFLKVVPATLAALLVLALMDER